MDMPSLSPWIYDGLNEFELREDKKDLTDSSTRTTPNKRAWIWD
jgi:hypothetical protein